MKNYYDILGVEKDANEQDIKTAYRKLSLKYHPDRNPDDKVSEEKFKEINEAYQTLGNVEKRQTYDLGDSGFPNFGGNDHINDILRSMGFNVNIDFDAGPFARNRDDERTQRIQVKQKINISLRDAVFGCDFELDVPSYVNCKSCNAAGGTRAQCYKCNGAGQTMTFLGTVQYSATCVTCNGKGYVLTTTCVDCNQEGFKRKSKHLKLKIPAGIQNNTALRINSESDEKSDIFIIISIAHHPKFSRNGATLFSTETISCLDAMIGGKITIETIDGNAELIIPAGTQHGQHLVVEGHGGVLTNGRANHVANIHIEIPKNLAPEQIKKIKDIRDKLKNSGAL